VIRPRGSRCPATRPGNPGLRQLLGIAHGVQPGDEAVVDAYRNDGVDLAVEAADQRRVTDEVAALVSLVAMINAANRLGVIVRQQGGSYEPRMFASMTS
jgi:hypothetical protein